MQAWEQFLQIKEAELGHETVKKWLRSLKVRRFDAGNLYLEAKDSFQLLWFEEHIRSSAQSLVNGNNRPIKIHLSIANALPFSKKTRTKGKSYPDTEKPFGLTFDTPDPSCTFEYFKSCEENEISVRLLHEIAGLSSETGTPSSTFNPIYIYGPTGSGKTHLLMSLAHAYTTFGLKTIYVRAETFTEHVVTAIRAGQMSTFRQAYRNADVLLIDDVHVFSRKGATQEEFFHTFNTLHLEGKQIILTACCAPPELQLIEPRLISRFEWGIVLPLKLLPREKLKEMLETKTQILHFDLSQQVIDYLLDTFTSNPKTLVKSLEALILRLHIGQDHSIQDLSVTAAGTLLADLLIEEQKSALTPLKIIQKTAGHFGIRSEDILGKAQTKECALPRQIAMHLCRNKLKMPYMKIGDIFSRDHSTVMASVKHIQKSLDQNAQPISGDWHTVVNKL